MKDYYYILGIKRFSSHTEIKKAYRKLSTKFHPDKNSGDKFFEDRFKDIQEAYETLSNETGRIKYNNEYDSFFSSTNSNKKKAPPRIIEFKVNKAIITKGEEITIIWKTINTDLVRLNCINGDLRSTGSKKVKITNIDNNKTVTISIEALNNDPFQKVESHIQVLCKINNMRNTKSNDEASNVRTSKPHISNEDPPKTKENYIKIFSIIFIVGCAIFYFFGGFTINSKTNTKSTKNIGNKYNYKYSQNSSSLKKTNKNQVSNKEEFIDKSLVQTVNELNRLCPLMIDRFIRLDNVSALPKNILQYNYTIINRKKEDIDIAKVKNIFEPIILNQIRTNPDLTTYRDRKITMIYNYRDNIGEFLFKLTYTADKYNSTKGMYNEKRKKKKSNFKRNKSNIRSKGPYK